MLEEAVDHLGDLIDRLVFLGGCATGLLITDNAAPPIRYTHDVDDITEVASLSAGRTAALVRAAGWKRCRKPGKIITESKGCGLDNGEYCRRNFKDT